jgi:DNA-binding IclR family transcriptional regulator
MVQTEDGQWRLGPAAGWLGARYQAGFDVNNVVEPALHQLVKETGESASFYVREGDIRSCVARVEGPQSVRHNVRIGERLPLDKGCARARDPRVQRRQGRSLRGHPRARLPHLAGEREAEVSSVAAPVFGLNWRLLGSMCISGPSSRLTKPQLEKHAKSVIRAANQLSYALAGSRSAATPAALSRWHP